MVGARLRVASVMKKGEGWLNLLLLYNRHKCLQYLTIASGARMLFFRSVRSAAKTCMAKHCPSFCIWRGTLGVPASESLSEEIASNSRQA